VTPVSVLTGIGAVAPNGADTETYWSATLNGVRGIGLLTLNLEVAYKLGIQVGGELVLMHQYTVGDYTVPSELIGRAWYQITTGPDRGFSGTIAPFPLPDGLHAVTIVKQTEYGPFRITASSTRGTAS